MLRIIGKFQILFGSLGLLLAIAGFRPEHWALNYWFGTSILTVVFGAFILFCAVQKFRQPEKQKLFSTMGWASFVVLGVIGSYLFQAGAVGSN